MPMPMTPHVPTSRRLRGLYMSTMLRVKSSAFAPSLTRMASGFALTMSRTTLSALWKFIGDGFFASVSAIFATFFVLRSAMASSHSAGGFGQFGPRCVMRRASPPRTSRCRRPPARRCGRCCPPPAARCRSGRTSGRPTPWRCLPPQVLPLPCDSSQLRRAPISITTSASGSTYERAADADCSCVSGSRPLAIDIGRYGMPVFSTSARMSASACAYAAPLPRMISGRLALLSRSSARCTASGAGIWRGAGSTTLISEFFPASASIVCGNSLAGRSR